MSDTINLAVLGDRGAAIGISEGSTVELIDTETSPIIFSSGVSKPAI
jgi:hypothetical protein